MFTGIVKELGTVAALTPPRLSDRRGGGVYRLSVQAPRLAQRLAAGESVAVNGVCLSVMQIRRGVLVFEVIPETQELTSLGTLRRGTQVNLESSLALSDRLIGYMLFGHVDATGAVRARRQRPGELVLDIACPPRLRPLLVPKGPIAVNGVSLTVGRSPGRSIVRVHLIPETLRRTTLGSLKAGDRVNLEVDYLAKLVWGFLAATRRRA